MHHNRGVSLFLFRMWRNLNQSNNKRKTPQLSRHVFYQFKNSRTAAHLLLFLIRILTDRTSIYLYELLTLFCTEKYLNSLRSIRTVKNERCKRNKNNHLTSRSVSNILVYNNGFNAICIIMLSFCYCCLISQSTISQSTISQSTISFFFAKYYKPYIYI